MNLNQYFININPVGLAGGARAKYVREVHEHLRWIYGTTSGRILLNCIRRPNFLIEIRPHPIAECNAVGGGEPTPVTGTPRGVVTYSPSEFSRTGSCSTLPAGQDRGRLWDEILFHELVHVFRNATGKWNNAPTMSYAMRHYDDNEEFIAVLCSNIYVSDRTNKIKSGLRAGHKDYSAMAAEDAQRFGLYTSSSAAFGLVKQFCADHPIFTKALSDKLADVIYNPIADFYRFPKLCELCSIFGAMKDRLKFRTDLTRLGMPAYFVDRIMSAI